MNVTPISDLCWDSVQAIDELEQADADAAIETLIDRIIAVLRRDPRMPTLPSDAWRLLFADAAARSREELGNQIGGMADLVEVVGAIITALEEAAAIAKTKSRKSHQQATPEAGATP